jgi:hypothetical protein
MLYPTLALVVQRVFAGGGSSVQDERNASAAGRVMDNRRAGLKPEKGESLVRARSELMRDRVMNQSD